MTSAGTSCEGLVSSLNARLPSKIPVVSDFEAVLRDLDLISSVIAWPVLASVTGRVADRGHALHGNDCVLNRGFATDSTG